MILVKEDVGKPLLAARGALAATRACVARVQALTAVAVTRDGKLDASLVEREQRRVHGLAWTATLAEGLVQLLEWSERLFAAGTLGEGECLTLQVGFGEYLAQILGGIAMSQNEFVRPVDLYAAEPAADLARDESVRWLLAEGNTAYSREVLANRLTDDWRPSESLGDATLDLRGCRAVRFDGDPAVSCTEDRQISRRQD